MQELKTFGLYMTIGALLIVIVGGGLVAVIHWAFGVEGLRFALILLVVTGLYWVFNVVEGRRHAQVMRSFAEMGEVFNRREKTDDDGEIRRMTAAALPQLISSAAQIGTNGARLGETMYRQTLALAADNGSHRSAQPFNFAEVPAELINDDGDELE